MGEALSVPGISITSLTEEGGLEVALENEEFANKVFDAALKLADLQLINNSFVDFVTKSKSP